MAVLYHVPILHTMEDHTAGLSDDVREAYLKENPHFRHPAILDGVINDYMAELIEFLFGELRSQGLLTKKKKFRQPVHMFLDGVSVPGHELIRWVREAGAHLESYMYEMLTRLDAAGAVLHKTELNCLLGHLLRLPGESDEVYTRRGGRWSELREHYIAGRVRRVLLRDPTSVGILMLGAGHPVLNFPQGIVTKLMHRSDLLPPDLLEFLAVDPSCPLRRPDDFGHNPAPSEA